MKTLALSFEGKKKGAVVVRNHHVVGRCKDLMGPQSAFVFFFFELGIFKCFASDEVRATNYMLGAAC